MKANKTNGAPKLPPHVFPTRNEEWGFFGTITRNGDHDPIKAWVDAFEWVVECLDVEPEMARDFLDSRTGRHIADQMNERESIRETLDRLCYHEGWRSDMLRTVKEIEREAKERRTEELP